MDKCDIVVIGAGPYGLSAAAHLRAVSGLEVRIFGEPMSFWSEHMPKGMFLRSNWTATQLACPYGTSTLENYEKEQQAKINIPVPVEQFIQYGLWYQNRTVPDVERRRISHVESSPVGFNLLTADGKSYRTDRVVIACGIESFARRPAVFRKLPRELVTHTCEHRDLDDFRGKEVLVVGSGQSGLETAALLHEAGAFVEVVGRSSHIHWLQGRLSTLLHHQLGSVIQKFLYAPTDVGPAGISQLLARPYLLQSLPRSLQNKLRRRATRPAGARWLVERLQHVPVRLGCSVHSVLPYGERVLVGLSDGMKTTVDHIILATGYEIDIEKYGFLAASLLTRIQRVEGFPMLQAGFESSVPGLHFLGAPAVYSFGPLLQFVSGTRFASPALTRAVHKAKILAA